MRLDTTYRGRDCLIPEVARNHNIGEQGTNMGDNFFLKFLANVAFNREPVSFLRTPSASASASAAPDHPATATPTATPNLEHMRAANYERDMHQQVSRAHLLGNFAERHVQVVLRGALNPSPSPSPSSAPSATKADQDLAALIATTDDWLVIYDRADYASIANMFGLLTSPRSGHKGLSTLRIGSAHARERERQRDSSKLGAAATKMPCDAHTLVFAVLLLLLRRCSALTWSTSPM